MFIIELEDSKNMKKCRKKKWMKIEATTNNITAKNLMEKICFKVGLRWTKVVKNLSGDHIIDPK